MGAADVEHQRARGRVVMHAGLPKAGSSSVQQWIEAHPETVRAAGVEPLCATVRRDRVELAPLGRASALSSWQLVRAYDEKRDPVWLERFRAALDAALESHPSVLVSCEGFGALLADGDVGLAELLARLTDDHDVVLALYVRPQHTSLEAAWKQWGFRSGASPSAYLRRRSKRLHYADLADHVRATAPAVDLVLRPFRPDLLDRGSVVVDFIGRFVGGAELPADADDWWSNPGLPLDLANLLHVAPDGLLTPGRRADAEYRALKEFAQGWTSLPSPDIDRSRLVLRHWCHRRFEDENQRVAEQFGWPSGPFIEPLDRTQRAAIADLPRGLDVIDQLWAPVFDDAERDAVYRDVAAALADSTPGTVRRLAGKGRRVLGR